jgi:predicted nucleotidyltransferase
MVEIESLKKDFSFLFGSDDILAILLYGSAAVGDETPRSDIDICIVLPSRKYMKDILNEIYRKLDVFTKKYDVRIFEELPLYIQINIIESNKIIYSKDIYELYEYFYFIRKLWEDQMMRQQVTAAEMAEILG